MKTFYRFMAALILIPNLVLAQYDEWDDWGEGSENTPSQYSDTTNSAGKVGLKRIDNQKIVIPFMYKSIFIDETPLGNEEIFFRVVNQADQEGIYSIADKKEIVPCKYIHVEKFYYDFFPNDPENAETFCAFIARKSADAQIPKDYFAINGTFIISTKDAVEWSLNSTTNLLTGLLYNEDDYWIKNGYFIFHRTTGKVIQNKLCNIIERSLLEQFVVESNHKMGVIDALTGNYLIPPIYDSIETDPEYIAYKGNSLEYIDNSGKIILPAGAYSAIKSMTCDDDPAGYTCALNVSKNGKWGCINQQNKTIIPIIYDQAFEYSDTMWVSKNGKWGSINNKNMELTVFQYDSIIYVNYESINDEDYISFDYYLVEKENKWGCIKVNGANILPIEFDRPVMYFDTMWVSKNGKWGCIDKSAKTLIDFKFDTTNYSNFQFNMEGISCLKNKQPYQLNYQGNEIIRKGLVEAVQTSDRNAVLQSIKNASSADKSLALYYAIYNINMEMFQLLLQNNPDLRTVSDNKPPIYHVALKAGSAYGDQKAKCFTMLSLLVQAGADINQKGWFGETPLMCYFKGNYNPDIEFVKALLNAGANVNLKDDYNKDVFDVLDNASRDIKDLLKSYRR